MIASVAIVTGAGDGVGEATALRLARDFGALALVARPGEDLADIAERVKGIGAQPLVIESDLTCLEAAKTVIRQTLRTFGRLDALIDIAGAIAAADLFDLGEEECEGAAQRPLGPRHVAIHGWDELNTAHGAVVLISGNAPEAPAAAQGPIGTINAAIEALAKTFAERDLGDSRCANGIARGSVVAGQKQAIIAKAASDGALLEPEAERQYLQHIGIARFGTADEIANLMAFLVSPQARWLTGTTARNSGEIRALR